MIGDIDHNRYRGRTTDINRGLQAGEYAGPVVVYGNKAVGHPVKTNTVIGLRFGSSRYDQA